MARARRAAGGADAAARAARRPVARLSVRPVVTAPGRNRPCPCGSGVKYKKCCGATPKPRYGPGDERDPAYWRALKAARNRFVFPDVAWEDPRTTAAMLGMPQRPGFEARRPPTDADFDWLIEQLERRAQAGAAGVWLRSASPHDELVFAVPLDRELTAAIKRLPGRRFDARRPDVDRSGRRRGWRPRWRRSSTSTRGSRSATTVAALARGARRRVVGDRDDRRPRARAGVRRAHDLRRRRPRTCSTPPSSASGANVYLHADTARPRGSSRRTRRSSSTSRRATALAALHDGRRPPGATLELGRDDDGARALRAAHGLAVRRRGRVRRPAGVRPRLPARGGVLLRVPAGRARRARRRRARRAPARAARRARRTSRSPTPRQRRLRALEAERDRAEATIALSLAHDAELRRRRARR